MKRTANYHLALTALLAILNFASCKKSGDPTSSSSKAKLLTSGTWTLRTVEFQKKDGTWETQPNATVYTLTFKDDKTVTAVTGTQVSVKAWSASDDFSQLNVVGTSGSGTAFSVNELSSSKLQLSLPYVISGYTNERDTYTH